MAKKRGKPKKREKRTPDKTRESAIKNVINGVLVLLLINYSLAAFQNDTADMIKYKLRAASLLPGCEYGRDCSKDWACERNNIAFPFLLSLAYRIAGISEAAGMALAKTLGLAMLASSYILIKKLKGAETAKIAAMLILASPVFIYFGTMPTGDMLLALTTVMMAYVITMEMHEIGYGALALAALTKSTGVLIAPIAILMCKRNREKAAYALVLLASALGFATACGQGYFRWTAETAIAQDHAANLAYYPIKTVTMGFPANLIAIMAITAFLHAALKKREPLMLGALLFIMVIAALPRKGEEFRYFLPVLAFLMMPLAERIKETRKPGIRCLIAIAILAAGIMAGAQAKEWNDYWAPLEKGSAYLAEKNPGLVLTNSRNYLKWHLKDAVVLDYLGDVKEKNETENPCPDYIIAASQDKEDYLETIQEAERLNSTKEKEYEGKIKTTIYRPKC